METIQSARRMLVVEDDPQLRRLMEVFFRGQGFDVDPASNGREALARIADQAYDIMLLDQRMPELSGLEVLAHLKTMRPRFPVIVLSAHGSEDFAVRAMQLGASDYMTKIPDVSFCHTLLEKVHRAIERFAEEAERQEQLDSMQQRISELGCLYALEKLFDSVECSPRNALLAAAELINPDDDACCVLIRIGKDEYASGNYCDTGHDETFDINERGQRIGSITIRCRPPSDSGGRTSLTELERDLMWAIADRIGHFMDFWRTEQRLRESNAALEEYAHVASHDLQAPLQKIESFVALLLEDYAVALDDTGRQYLSVVARAAHQMRVLVKDVLALSRLDAGDIELKPVSLDDLLLRVREQLSSQLLERRVELRVEPLPAVPGDETRLFQLFQNLLSNAIKFNDADKPCVDIGAEEDAEGTWIYVRDNGIGMKYSDAERIFLPFKRLHSGDRYAGTGIGLALCRKIMRQHEGTIEVKSKLGRGSTFWLRFARQTDTGRDAINDTNTRQQQGEDDATD